MSCRPFNLKVIPDTDTEIAVEEEMIPGFSNLQGAEPAMHSILHVPMSSFYHIFSIQSVHDEHPSKDFNLESAGRFPNPRQQRVESFRLKCVGVKHLGPELLG